MSKLKPIFELLKAAGQAIGNPLRGPLPQPQPVPPTIPRPVPSRPRPQPQPQPQPRPEPPAPQPRRPVPPPETDPWLQPEPEPTPEPDPEADSQTETEKAPKTEDDQHCRNCPECVARDMGASVPHHFGNVRSSSKRGYDYQHFVCPWHYYVPESNLIEEWKFMGEDFDGLHPTECHLYEAKHGYDGFLRQDDWSAGGRPKPRGRWADGPFEKMLEQAERQSAVVAPHYPDVRLTWVFSSMMTKLYVFQIFLDEGLAPPIDAEVRPFVQRGYDE